MIAFSMLGFYWWRDGWWFEICGIETDEWHGYLFYIDSIGSIDFLFLRNIIRKFKDD